MRRHGWRLVRLYEREWVVGWTVASVVLWEEPIGWRITIGLGPWRLEWRSKGARA